MLNPRDIMNCWLGRAREKLISAEDDATTLSKCLSLSVTETPQNELLQSRHGELGLSLPLL